MKQILLILFAALIFSGCIDDPVQQNSITINGNVYSEWVGAPVAFIDVTTNYFTIFRTSYGGAFYLNNTITPYNLNVFVSHGFTTYLGITNNNPMPVTNLGYHYPKECNVLVHYPLLSQGHHVFIKLISDDFHRQDRESFENETDSAEFKIDMLPSESYITGKFIYLEIIGGYGYI